MKYSSSVFVITLVIFVALYFTQNDTPGYLNLMKALPDDALTPMLKAKK